MASQVFANVCETMSGKRMVASPYTCRRSRVLRCRVNKTREMPRNDMCLHNGAQLLAAVDTTHRVQMRTGCFGTP